MSTKIYRAVRCPVGNINNVLLELRNMAMIHAATEVKRFARRIDGKAVLNLAKDMGASRGKDVTKRLLTEARYQLAFKEAIVSSQRPERAVPLDIDASCNVWVDKGKAYMILYGPLWPSQYVPPGAEDYAYWNNTDRPDAVSARAWKARGDTWDRVVLDHDWNATRMVHTIISAKEETGLHELCKLVLPGHDPYAVLP